MTTSSTWTMLMKRLHISYRRLSVTNFHREAIYGDHLFCQEYSLVTWDCSTQFPIWGQKNKPSCLTYNNGEQKIVLRLYQVVLQNNNYTRNLLHPPWKYGLEEGERSRFNPTWYMNPALSPLSFCGRSQLSRSPPPGWMAHIGEECCELPCLRLGCATA